MSSSCATVFPAGWGRRLCLTAAVSRDIRGLTKDAPAARKKALATLRTTTLKQARATTKDARRYNTMKSLSLMSNFWFVMVHPLGLLAVAPVGLRDQGRS